MEEVLGAAIGRLAMSADLDARSKGYIQEVAMQGGPYTVAAAIREAVRSRTRARLRQLDPVAGDLYLALDGRDRSLSYSNQTG